MPPQQTFTTSELADAAACGCQTLRYYERRGLLPEPPRTVGGHRMYGPQHLKRVRCIQAVQRLGFHLDEIQELFSAKKHKGARAGEAEQTIDRFIERVDEKAMALSEIRSALSKMRAQAERDLADEG